MCSEQTTTHPDKKYLHFSLTSAPLLLHLPFSCGVLEGVCRLVVLPTGARHYSDAEFCRALSFVCLLHTHMALDSFLSLNTREIQANNFSSVIINVLLEFQCLLFC